MDYFIVRYAGFRLAQLDLERWHWMGDHSGVKFNPCMFEIANTNSQKYTARI